MKRCDLRTIYEDLASRLPARADGNENIILSSANLPAPPARMRTGELYVTKGEHHYNEWYKIDSLYFFARKETYRHLGLAVLSALFHLRPNVEIELAHPHGDIRSFVIECYHPNMDAPPAGYSTRPLVFNYYGELPGKHPFPYYTPVRDLPCFHLANADNRNYTDEDWKRRDAVKLFGSDAGLVTFAELLLNLSSPDNEQDEIELEGESGFRGVGVGSAEVRLFLPGHLYWTEEHWQEGS